MIFTNMFNIAINYRHTSSGWLIKPIESFVSRRNRNVLPCQERVEQVRFNLLLFLPHFPSIHRENGIHQTDGFTYYPLLRRRRWPRVTESNHWSKFPISSELLFTPTIFIVRLRHCWKRSAMLRLAWIRIRVDLESICNWISRRRAGLLAVCDIEEIDLHGHLCLAKVYDYLLEKSRVVQHGPGERTFHFFYYLFAGLEKEALEYFYLDDPETYRWELFFLFSFA